MTSRSPTMTICTGSTRALSSICAGGTKFPLDVDETDPNDDSRSEMKGED